MPTAPNDAVGLFLDILLPGDAQWPSASQALAIGPVVAALEEADRDWLVLHAQRLAVLPQTSRIEAMTGLERADPGAFGRILQSLYTAYYATSATSVQVRRLAEASPRESAKLFDTSLLDRVITTQAGRRRTI